MNNSKNISEYEITIDETKEQHIVPFDYLPNITKDLDALSKKRSFSSTDIYRITLWKVNRYPEDVNEIAKEVNSAMDSDDISGIMKTLLTKKGVGLPMASTYLRFRDPSKYQIIDVRALRMAFDFEPDRFDEIHKCFPSLGTAGYEVYDKYLKQLRHIAQNGYHGIKVDFCNLDRFLYDVDKAFGHKIDATEANADWVAIKHENENEQTKCIIEKLRKYNDKIEESTLKQ